MRTRFTMRCAAFAAAVSALIAGSSSPAAAQDGPPEFEPVARCVERIESRADSAVESLKSNAARARAVIAALDENDAGDRAIVQAGRRGLERNAERASTGREMIRTTVGRCVAWLEELGAPRNAIGTVRRAGADAIGAITTAQQAAGEAIRSAVARAIGEDPNNRPASATS